MTADSDDPDDAVCDGAGDNASGVAAVLEIGRRLADDPPSRSVVLALWDAEEDGRLGSIAAVESGVLDLDAVVAYLNWDMQGINLLPSLADTTFVIGAETGGPALEDAVATGVGSTDLLPVDLSLLFGQGRSDHAASSTAGVPSVFFTDATSACYHTAQDDLEHLDLDKLARQIDLGETVTRAVAGPGARPTFTADAPAASFADAEASWRSSSGPRPTSTATRRTPRPTSSSSSPPSTPWSPTARPPSTTTTPPPSSPAPPPSSSSSPRATATTSSTDRWRSEKWRGVGDRVL